MLIIPLQGKQREGQGSNERCSRQARGSERPCSGKADEGAKGGKRTHYTSKRNFIFDLSLKEINVQLCLFRGIAMTNGWTETGRITMELLSMPQSLIEVIFAI